MSEDTDIFGVVGHSVFYPSSRRVGITSRGSRTRSGSVISSFQE